MKRKLKICMIMLIMAAAFMISGITVLAGDTVTVKMTGTYGQTEARSMLAMINEFRTGNDAWYWNSDNTTKTTCSGLKELTYDYELEQIAMLRAMEIALSFSHTRPNGTKVYSLMNWSVAGENIAAGYKSAEAAFVGWQETNENYSGQGHRRNMLDPDFTAVGIGHVYYNGYHYWVQVFRNPTGSAAATAANDSETTVSIEILSSSITSVAATPSPSSLTVAYGASTALPAVTLKIQTADTWPSRGVTVAVPYEWTSASTTYADISSGNVAGKKAGSTSITTSLLGTAVSVPVTVTPLSITDASVTLSQSSYTYDGSAKTPAVSSVKLNGTTLTSGTDYTVAYSNNTNAGTATVTITGKGNYTGTATKTFTITPASISPAVISAISSQTYTGNAITPSFTVKLGTKTLTSGTDYTTEYSNNTNAGTATVKVTGTGNYMGTISSGFTVTAINLSSCTVSSIAQQTYTGSAVTPAVTVKWGTKTLTLNSDYTVQYTNNTNVGTASVTITGKGNFTGTASASFTIAAANISSAAVGNIAAQTYTGSELKPQVSVTWNSKTLASGTDYTVGYTNNTNAGTATVTITGKGNFTGTKTASFTITPAGISGASISSISAQTYTGNVITPSFTVKLGTKTLTAGTDYKTEYLNNTNAGTATVKVTGTGNYTGTVSSGFTITAINLSSCTVSSIAQQTYTGSAVTPAVTVKWGTKTLTLNSDYTVQYTNNTNVGTASVTITGKGNFTGTASASFTIAAANISSAAVGNIAAQTYTGSELKPQVSVTWNSKTLASGTDYTVGYTNNTNAGTATVTITGKGNFTGTKTASFTITPAGISGASISSISAQTYTGNAITPSFTVKLGTKTLTAGTDYKTEYLNNTNAGTATVKVTGTGNYTGTVSSSFTIKAATSTGSGSSSGSGTTGSGTSTGGGTSSGTGTTGSGASTGSGTTGSGASTGSGTTGTGAAGTTPAAGTVVKDTASGAQYRITKAGTAGNATVEYTAPVSQSITKVVIPATVNVNGVACKVTSIAANAFKNNKKLKKVTIGSNVTTIGKNAFYGCTKLTTVTMGSNVTAIKAGAFRKCTALTKITIPAKVTSIGKQAFYGCKKLKTITIKTKSLTTKTVGKKAFGGIYSKAAIKVPSGKLKAYKKLLRARGVSSKAKIKK